MCSDFSNLRDSIEQFIKKYTQMWNEKELHPLVVMFHDSLSSGLAVPKLINFL